MFATDCLAKGWETRGQGEGIPHVYHELLDFILEAFSPHIGPHILREV